LLHEIRRIAGTGDRSSAVRLLLRGLREDAFERVDRCEHIAEIRARLDPPVAPFGPLTQDEWIELYQATGYFVGPPSLPFEIGSEVRLYRAAPIDRVRGISWCTDRSVTEDPFSRSPSGAATGS
jgi:hypothetical protein